MNSRVPDVIPTVDCQVCGTRLPEPALDLGLQPLCDDLVPIHDDRETPRYPIQIALCLHCLTAHQRFNVRKERLFPPQYHYRPRFTQDVVLGMADLVERQQGAFGTVAGKLVCDVGCNDGSLLTLFRQAGARTCGIEPTGAALEAAASGHAIVNDFFTVASARRIATEVGRPDIVTFTNVFAHIQDLSEAIAALRVLIGAGTHVIIENHYLGSVLDANQFDTFYHEHPRTYSVRSFEHIARALGGSILSVAFPRRYGGNIRVVIGDFTGAPASATPPVRNVEAPFDEAGFPARFAALQQFVTTWEARTSASIHELAASGLMLSGKSFPARASILINLLRLEQTEHAAIYERPGSLKIGNYVPGTRIPVLSDERWTSGADRPDGIIIWGWHIASEIAVYLRERGYRGRLFQPLPAFTEI